MTWRRLASALGATLKRGILGRSTHEYMKRYARSDSVPVVNKTDAGERPPPLVFEPVFGWTQRQLDDYLARNPGYRLNYEAALQKTQNGKEMTNGTQQSGSHSQGPVQKATS